MSDRWDGLAAADPFDLPEWLGTEQVTWVAESGIRAGHRVRGRLRGSSELGCDLLAIDTAYPRPVLGEVWRTPAHRAWHDGQVELGRLTRGQGEDRLVLLVPGVGFDAEVVLAALSRLACAVGARPQDWSVLLRMGEG